MPFIGILPADRLIGVFSPERKPRERSIPDSLRECFYYGGYGLSHIVRVGIQRVHPVGDGNASGIVNIRLPVTEFEEKGEFRGRHPSHLTISEKIIGLRMAVNIVFVDFRKGRCRYEFPGI